MTSMCKKAKLMIDARISFIIIKVLALDDFIEAILLLKYNCSRVKRKVKVQLWLIKELERKHSKFSAEKISLKILELLLECC